MSKIVINFLNFLQFLGFFLIFRQVSQPIMTCLLFCEHLGILLAEKNCLDLCAFVILKSILTFPSFLVKVVSKTYFFLDLASSIIRKSHTWFKKLLVVLMK